MTPDEILDAVIVFIRTPGYPGQPPYRERLVDLFLEAFEQGGPRSPAIGDAYADRHGDAPEKLSFTTERWSYWWELLESGAEFGTLQWTRRPPEVRTPPHLREPR